MYMAYTSNPKLPQLRMQAVNLLKNGWSTREVALHLNYNQSTIVRWWARGKKLNTRVVPTVSSRPHHHPRELAPEIVEAIVAERLKHNRCAEVVHHSLVARGIQVSLSSVKRTLARKQLIAKRSPWKRWHLSTPRPEVALPGDLVELDTVHRGPAVPGRLYLYTLIDVCSRWADAAPSLRINTHRSLRFVRAAQDLAPFTFVTLQSDNGSEWSTYFSEQIGVAHRHSRVRTPNDNGHLERFNRTIQEECLDRIPQTLRAYRRAIPEYLRYYNTERPHLGLDLKTPLQVMRSY